MGMGETRGQARWKIKEERARVAREKADVGESRGRKGGVRRAIEPRQKR